ncbi:MAG: pyruvate kinase [Chloroflexota bacterium]|nr:pyruvate kinase [Chloroflexota bacterium]
MLRTKIVCTIGPATDDPEVLRALTEAGMNVARFNMSHGSQEYHGANITNIREISLGIKKAVGVLVDLQGPKLRVGTMPEEGILLEKNQKIVLSTDDIEATRERVPVQFEGLAEEVTSGNHILIDDGLLELVVESSNGKNEVVCRVETGGVLRSNKGMNLPRADLAIPCITAKDREDLRFALQRQADWIALSFVRRAEDVLELKELIRDTSPFGRMTPVIAKIEKPEAVDNIDSIIEAADGIMVARGDLGIETSPESVPMMQKMIIRKCLEAGKTVITATQMLDSMIRNPRPTRAEASDVANAILDGTDAIMLSGETAVGKYPVKSVQTMVRIAREVEKNAPYTYEPHVEPAETITEAVCMAAADIAESLCAAAIIVPTVGGTTARTLAAFRPSRPIIAVTMKPTTLLRLTLVWGVHPLLSPRTHSTNQVVIGSVTRALEVGMIQEGDTVVVTAGAVGTAPGVTDLIKVHTVARTLARGLGVGSEIATGQVRRLQSPLAGDVELTDDEIAVTDSTDRSFINALSQAAGLITSTGGVDNSHCALLASELGLPAILGIGEDIDALEEGQWIKMDAEKGVVTELYPDREANVVRQ